MITPNQSDLNAAPAQESRAERGAAGDALDLASSPGVFYREEDGRISAASSHVPGLVQGEAGGLDPLGVAQEAAFGFQLGNRTLFQSVKRLLPCQQVIEEDGQLQVRDCSPEGDSGSMIDGMTQRVCDAFAGGAALELTGGLDSRLLLAFGLSKGVKPALAFTLGDEDHPDVRSAANIANEFQFPHIRIPVVVDASRVMQDAFDVVRAAGYSINAASYAWLPGTLAQLDDKRDAQVSGTGGEMSGGFYYTPFDALIDPLGLHGAWVKGRLMQQWINWRSLWRTDAVREIEAALISEAVRVINRPQGPWRARVDELYRNERMRRWAIPVLDMSRRYYRVITPYVSPEYLAWGRALPLEKRVGRAAQHELLQEVHAPLAAFRSNTSGPLHPPKPVAIAKKLMRRLSKADRPSPMGTTDAAKALAAQPKVRELVHALLEKSGLPLEPQRAVRLLEDPTERPELFGVLLTAAIAWHDLHADACESAAAASPRSGG